MKYLVLSTLLFLVGCGFTAQGDFVRDQISQKGAQAMDEGLRNSEWFLCNAASVGSIKRRYAGDKAEAYTELCEDNSQVPGLSPE